LPIAKIIKLTKEPVEVASGICRLYGISGILRPVTNLRDDLTQRLDFAKPSFFGISFPRDLELQKTELIVEVR
jgi:hypothetical protein